VQVDPSKCTLKAPGSKRLKVECDILLSTFGFKNNLRRYIKGLDRDGSKTIDFSEYLRQGLTLVPISAQLELLCPPYNLN